MATTVSTAAATAGTKMVKSVSYKLVLDMILRDIPCEISRSWQLRNNYSDYLVKEIFTAIEKLLSAEQAKTAAAKEDVRAARRERDEHKAEIERLNATIANLRDGFNAANFLLNRYGITQDQPPADYTKPANQEGTT